ncbi:hypothetical protein HAX54_017183 [Datura stramonium]|uniref:Uncharacterized protein n=1 Tax=Datura stramonium TaxID=4076 RepID=A0ABS8UME4_DATST|nr:hypothetical protein [Datura stramonium]
MDTLAINSNESDNSKLIDINQFDFVISNRKQKHVREAQPYKDKSTVVVVMRRYAIDQRFQYKVHRSNSKRPIVIVDDSHLKSKLKGTFVSARRLDGAGSILPLAYGVINIENDAS